mmetsp:Transcript_7365/g.11195  ORF Transcript_7365/g.11195 Transcript_7365/m.11195 type:complete len:814 (+) Transcript_7365:436-2877(+)
MAATESQVQPQQGAWQQPTGSEENIRSVTPAMNNTRGGGQAAQRGKFPSRVPSPAAPSRSASPSGPSSTGLIRLTLRKPMGIVFEPMYDPNAPSIQRGVRICDLPRTGAAALSRRLEIGDELLSINDKTMSRLTFDEIMDFIIEADPEQVNLLFRRPRKEVLAARAMKSTPSNANAATNVKWIDDNDGKKEKKRSSSKSKKKKEIVEDDETLDTLDETNSENQARKSSRKKKSSDHRSSKEKDGPYENESFLDLLIDTICANPDNVCKNSSASRREEYDSEDDATLDPDDRTMTSYDDSTYVTYESTDRRKEESVYDETDTEDDRNKKDRKYEDDTTLDTYEQKMEEKKKVSEKKKDKGLLSPFRKKQAAAPPALKESPKAAPVSPKAASPSPKRIASPRPKRTPTQPPVDSKPMSNPPELTADDANKAPITDLEFDDDNAADVSVMESLGGPSLLIEKQRQAQMLQKEENAVPADIINDFGADYPADYGLTREQTINKNPIKFYAFVVRHLLEEHEPEKVRLLDKLLAKYKGREDHLVQKLSVRYNRKEESQAFTEAVKKTKDTPETERAVQKAQERAAAAFGVWPDKETKEPEPVDVPVVVQNQDKEEDEDGEDEEDEEEDSDFSGDSIDGTSPAVIAQVSELLNYVYGKTSVPGQIDRVSTIMRAYEGREAVLLELLETKALIKANSEKENAANLPAFLRNSPALAPKQDVVSPLSSPPNQNEKPNSMINDDVSSMSGVSSPVPETKAAADKEAPASKRNAMTPSGAQRTSNPEFSNNRKKNSQKKKGLFGGLFKKKSSRIRGRKEESEI